MHTTFSDGHYTPTELIKKVNEQNINIVSITDHDSLNGLEEAIAAGEEFGIKVIPGVEISTDVEDREVHLLGYFIDINNSELKKYLSFFRDERIERAKIMVNKLVNLGFDISINDVLDVAKDSAVGRPHVALAMMNKGIVTDFYEAFQKYLRDDGPAYERKIHVSSQSALKLIADAGGLSFIAHPGHMKESILMSLINAGVDGIEVIHPSHNDYQKKYYKGIVNQYCLLESGGSDFHGGIKGDEENLGRYLLDPKRFQDMGRILN
ncbi:MAG: PHP domain-containing protein [Bacteroidetes bacterium]|nr:PHP domain-containing protein [Bacteroidota bacterium]MBU1113551.1 PHP domain-containing protein [Bacteroidota bacterium]MBU1800287.1 PHP domain-containing protein [Bacteroidota bacterium]